MVLKAAKPLVKHPRPILSVCRVCADEASGIHYGVTSCEGCKVCIYHEHYHKSLSLHGIKIVHIIF